ncbi:MAG: Transcriptional regulator, AcrR family [uncultured Rubrobacteraceae bacterium]|uniref:Transcriptional regulator, AcrR family n=1 Tax=uncultured Rubrobacteraceae bacterium TaxID=349277 RepID=A0A6J4QAY0_9ACTN|nr:MAG: Transcriptional regulator, AcrR family [uncultured Rubrobacteraceae bacterium]
MVRDSAATRNRILDAAIGEFAAHGLAGGRVGRIADVSGANQRSIYVYFGSKEGLFNAALRRVIGGLVGAVPLTEDDLPGYAGRMFDYLLDHPEALRMGMWRHLERPASGPDTADVYAEKVEAMAGGSGLTASGLPPTDLLVLVQGLTSSWLTSPQDLLAAADADPYSPERLAAHRAVIVEAARRLCAPVP